MLAYLSAQMTTTLAHMPVPVQVPDPGAGTQPPGFEKFTDVMGWIKWLALGVLVIALIAAGAMMAINQRRGEAGEDATKVMKVLMGAMVISGASALIGFLVADPK